jgi:hypothetical protein
VAVPPRDDPPWTIDQRERVGELIDGYRIALHDSLDELTDEEARLRLVASKTTMLGLVKHATFVEAVWFDQAITGRSYADMGVASTVDGSFTLRTIDTIATVQAPTGNGGRPRGRTSTACAAMTSWTAEARVPSGRSSCRSSESSRSTLVTPTSCESRSSPAAPRVDASEPGWPKRRLPRTRPADGRHRSGPDHLTMVRPAAGSVPGPAAIPVVGASCDTPLRQHGSAPSRSAMR